MKKILSYWKWAVGALGIAAVLFLVARPGSGSAEWVSVQKAEFGPLDVTVTADGSVVSHQEVDLNPKTSGVVEGISVEEGDFVRAGQLLLSLDAYDAGLSVSNAELDLQSAQLKLDQLKQAADATDLKTAENAVSQAQQDLEDVTTRYTQDKVDDEVALGNAEEDLEQERVDAYSLTAEAFAELPTTLATVQDVIEGRDYQSNQDNINYYHDRMSDHEDLVDMADDLEEQTRVAENTYRAALDAYNATDVNSSSEDIVTLLDGTTSAAEQFSVLLKNADVFLLSIQDQYNTNETEPVYLQDHIDTIEAAIVTLNPQLSALSNEVQTLQNLQQDVEDAQRDLDNLEVGYSTDLKQAQLTLEVKELALEDVQNGTDPDDVQAQVLAVSKAENALASAQKKYDDLFLRAPFDGTVTTVSVDLGQAVSSGTTVFTLVSATKLVEVSLNEVDVTQVEVGQKGTVTFDALPGVSVPVTLAFVSEIHDAESSVIQYESHLRFDEEVPDLKEGMTAHLVLTLKHVDNVLLIPKTALKTDGDKMVVEIATGVGLQEKTLYARSSLSVTTQEVTVGTMGADAVEALSGVSEGAWVVFYSAAEQISAPVTTRPSGAFGEGAIDNGPQTSEE